MAAGAARGVMKRSNQGKRTDEVGRREERIKRSGRERVVKKKENKMLEILELCRR